MVHRHRRPLIVSPGRSLIRVVLALVGALMFSSPLAAGDPTTTPEIIEMLAEGIPEDVIEMKIEYDGCDCMASPEFIVALQEKASQRLVSLVIQLSAQAHFGDPVTTPVIVAMLSQGLSEELILEDIAAAGCGCDTSAASLIELRRSGASDELLATLIQIAAAEEPTSGTEEPVSAVEEPVVTTEEP